MAGRETRHPPQPAKRRWRVFLRSQLNALSPEPATSPRKPAGQCVGAAARRRAGSYGSSRTTLRAALRPRRSPRTCCTHAVLFLAWLAASAASPSSTCRRADLAAYQGTRRGAAGRRTGRRTRAGVPDAPARAREGALPLPLPPRLRPRATHRPRSSTRGRRSACRGRS